METTRQCRSIPDSVTLLLGATLLIQLVLCVACGSPVGSDSSQLPTGPRAGQLAAHRTSLTFGTVTVGNSSSQTVTVTASVASVTITQANITGDGFSVIAPTLPTTLMAGESASFTVEFTPSVAGSVTGSVSLVSNAGNSPPTIAVSGTGADMAPPPPPPSSPPPPPLSVALSWDASPSDDVAGYYVYRGTQSGGPYERLAPLLIPTTTYTDSSVSAGTTYYYVVTAVDGQGLESIYSNEASATITNP
jgi:Abnormal spindle-like microcephaly-assoc'd, ASPM-SPD-2-Hydin